MSELDEIEKEAREVMAKHEEYAEFCRKSDNHVHVFEDVRFARLIVAVLPIVKAAVAWSESFGELSKRLPPHVHDLRRAVDEYETAISKMREELK